MLVAFLAFFSCCIFAAEPTAAQTRLSVQDFQHQLVSPSRSLVGQYIVEIKGRTKGKAAKPKRASSRLKARKSINRSRLQRRRVEQDAKLGRPSSAVKPPARQLLRQPSFKARVLATPSLRTIRISSAHLMNSKGRNSRQMEKFFAKPIIKGYAHSVELNARYLARNKDHKAPHDPIRPSKTIVTKKNTEMIRVYSQKNGPISGRNGSPVGSWMMRKKDFEKYQKLAGGNRTVLAKLLANKLALEVTPTHFVPVKVPTGTRLNTSYAKAQSWNGGVTGGGLQINVLARVRQSWITGEPKKL